VSELAWAAGFFDGEGTIYNRTRKQKYSYYNLEIAQRDIRPLERFLAAVGEGKIIPRKARGRTKEHFMWVCWQQEGVMSILNKLWPYLSEPKKEQTINVTGKGGSCGV
jgi:hypothetical protein